jgi:hypothetical protein
LKRGRVPLILLAGGIGYLLGGWHAATSRSIGLSAAQTVALRFPEDRDAAATAATASVSDAAPGAQAGATGAVNAPVLGNAQLALLSPAPMVPQTIPQSVPQAAVQTASAEDAAPAAPLPDAVAPHPVPRPMPTAAHPASEIKSAVAPVHHHANRPGFMLNDAQIASIRRRLNLTPDQEQMWPAVEAALRNLAYTSTRDARRRGAPASAAQLASADPNSAEVQDLKSAAIPLIMSFNNEQKDEVRSLAHVMGLDKLASEF